MAACATGGPQHDEPSDFDPVNWSDGKGDTSGVPATFDRNNVMADSVFVTPAVDGAAVQQFLEDSPYGTRSWLADLTMNGRAFSQIVVDVANERGVDPVVLLARMQVEASLVSATTKPSASRIDTALGCSCTDAGGCSSSDLGLYNQLYCAAKTFEARLSDSQEGTGWTVGVTRSTYDHYRVSPKTNATAALYAYTPWVLIGEGGNWLVWNVTRKFLKHFDQAGTLQLP